MADNTALVEQISKLSVLEVSELVKSLEEKFGVKAAAPVFTSPIGVLEMMHPDADLAVARATSRLNVPMIISSQASFPMEEIAKANGDGPRFYQLYWGKSDAVAESFVKRAEACGCVLWGWSRCQP